MLAGGFSNTKERDNFFIELSNKLRQILPPGLQKFEDKTELEDNWLKLRYPGKLVHGSYELQFTTAKSEHHTHLYGSGENIILSFYYDEKRKLRKWLEAIRPYQQLIEDQLGQNVIIDNWSENWTTIGLRLDESQYGTQTTRYAITFSHFIQATFIPALLADRACGYID